MYVWRLTFEAAAEFTLVTEMEIKTKTIAAVKKQKLNKLSLVDDLIFAD